jgi:DNA repair exonuclease SbcCD ATPase subunit
MTTRRKHGTSRASKAQVAATKRSKAAGGSGAGRGREVPPKKTAAAGKQKAATAELTACRQRIAALEAELARIEKEREAEREANERQLDRAQQEFEDQLTSMVQELGLLRHHEARAESLERALDALNTRAHDVKRLSAVLKGRSVSRKSS